MSTSTVAPVPVRSRVRPLERVEAEIVELASRITAASARLIELIGEFDAAEGWLEWGARSTAHWLSWQTGIGLGAGREQVRVARALRDLPVIAASFAAGRLSYSKVRALTRFAKPDTESELVIIAEHATGAHIERIAASVRRAKRATDVQARRKAAYVRWHQDEDGSIVGTFRLAPEQAAVFCHGLDVACGQVTDISDEDRAKDGNAERSAADGLVAMAAALLKDVSAETSSERAELFQLVLHTTPEELAKPDNADDDSPGSHLTGGNGRVWRVAPSTARRLSCDCSHSTMVDGPDGAALHLSRRTRRIRGRLRRAVHARDRGMCRAPGCTEPATQIHHLWHWAMGGPTCLRNLISLCDHHHWLVHEGGYALAVRDSGGWVLISPDGLRVGPTPEPHTADQPLPTDPDIQPDAVTGKWDGSRLDPDPIVAIVLRREQRRRAAENVSAETSTPVAPSQSGDEEDDFSTLRVRGLAT